MKTILFFFGILVATCFDAVADSWTQKADLGGAARFGAVGFSINGKGYIGTGLAEEAGDYSKSFWEYDPVFDIWSQKADFGGEGRIAAAGFSIGSKGYLGIGALGNICVNDFWEYDSQTNAWTQKASFPGAKRWGAIAFSIGSKGYIGTGQTCGGTQKKDFWEYDPSTDVWTKKADYGGGNTDGAAAFSINDKGYVGTGEDALTVNKNDFWEYNPTTNVWTQKANFPGSPRVAAIGFSILGFGHLALGANNYQNFTDVWQYDPSIDSWSQNADYPGNGLQSAVGFGIDSKGYVGTGTPPMGGYEKDFWEYSPDILGCITPTGLTTTNISSTSAQLNWNTVTSATKYKVKWKESTASSWNNITVNAPTTSTTLTGLSANTKYKWKVKSVCGSGVSSDFSSVVKFTTLLRLGEESAAQSSFMIYPNPVITSTTISFSLEQDSYVSMELLDFSGRKMKTLLDANTEAGNHQLQLNREQLTAGIYFLHVKMNGETSVMKIVIQ